MSDIFVQPLASGMLDSDIKTLYTPPANKQAELSSLWVENISAGTVTLSVKFKFAGSERRFITSLSLDAGDKGELLDGFVTGLMVGDEILAGASVNGAVTFILFGKVGIQ